VSKSEIKRQIITRTSFALLATFNNLLVTGASADRYRNAFTYDANGNILTQTRYNEAGVELRPGVSAPLFRTKLTSPF